MGIYIYDRCLQSWESTARFSPMDPSCFHEYHRPCTPAPGDRYIVIVHMAGIDLPSPALSKDATLTFIGNVMDMALPFKVISA